ncbi:MAG: hypothetical protein U0807_01510 [Candidatus Binatia bacterium]
MPSFSYASAHDPLDAYTLEQMAIGVATRKYRRTLDPLPGHVTERAISKSAVSCCFVALLQPQAHDVDGGALDGLDIRVLFIDGLHFRDHVILLVLASIRTG